MAPLVVQAVTCLLHMPSPLQCLHGPSGGAGRDLPGANALALAWPLWWRRL